MAESTNATGGCRKVGLKINDKILTFSLGRLNAKEKVTIKYVCKVDVNELPEASDYHFKNYVKSTSTGENLKL